MAALHDRSRSGITGILPPPGFQSPYSVWLCTNTCAVDSPPLWIPLCDLFFIAGRLFLRDTKRDVLCFLAQIPFSAVQCSAVRCGVVLALQQATWERKKALGVMMLNAHRRFPGEIPRCTY